MKTLLALLFSILLVGLAHAQSGRPQGEVRNFPDIRPSTKTMLPRSSFTPLPKKTVTRGYAPPVRKVVPVKRHIITPVRQPARSIINTTRYYYEQPYYPTPYTYTCQWYYWDGWRCRCLDYLFGGY